jgi:uncharacterized protein
MPLFMDVHSIAGGVSACRQTRRSASQPEYSSPTGNAGYFTDPDGHAWEIAYKPGFALGRDGAITLPDFDA